MDPENANQKAAQARRDYLEALLTTFESPAGRIILRSLHTAAGTRRPAYTPGGNPNDALWRDGRKSIVLEIEAHLEEARKAHGSTPTDGKPPVTGGPPAKVRRPRKQGG